VADVTAAFHRDTCTVDVVVGHCFNTLEYISALKPKLIQIIFKNSVRTAKKTQHFTIIKISWLTLFKEIIAVYSENHTNTHKYKSRVTDC
jgi:hypothetical protein